MDSGYKMIFWGLFFSTFHINLGVLQVLPAFVGWLFIMNGIYKLYSISSYDWFQKAYYYSIAVMAFSFLGFIITITGAKIDIMSLIPLFSMILELPFIYYLITGSIMFLKQNSKEEEVSGYDYKLRIYMIIFIINTIFGCIGYTMIDKNMLFLCGLIGVIQVLWLMYIVSRFKNIVNLDD